MVKKWQTMTEVYVDIQTAEGYWLHLFCVGFTKKMQQSDSEVLLGSAKAGPPNLEKDDGNHDPRGADK